MKGADHGYSEIEAMLLSEDVSDPERWYIKYYSIAGQTVAGQPHSYRQIVNPFFENGLYCHVFSD
jgi:hypothetical protein